MARIKPQALLLQSKKKKGPTRISLSKIVVCNLVICLIVLFSVSTYRYWSKRSKDQIKAGLSNIQDADADADVFVESKKHGLPGYAILNTSKGYITAELHKEQSPETVQRFLDLCKKGYFRGMPFSHVIKHYVIQGGEYQGLGAAKDLISEGKLHLQLGTSPKHEAFMLGTSKSRPGNKGFDLFITTAPIPDLNDKFILFGRVIKGEDVVQEIEEVDTDEHYQPQSSIGIINIALKHRI